MSTVGTTWEQALAWRLERQLVAPVGHEPVVEVVQRLGAVPAKQQRLAELTVGLRRARPRPGEVARALADGHLVNAFAFRGGAHYLSPEDGGARFVLSLPGAPA